MPPKKKSISEKPETISNPKPVVQPVRVTRRSARKDSSEIKPEKKSAPKAKESNPEPKNSKKLIGKDKKATTKQVDKDGDAQKAKPSVQPPKKDTPKQQQKSELTKVMLKGTIPVDKYFSKAATYKVYTNDSAIYATTLNQSNISANNNKFYIIQLVVNENNKEDIYLFTRWGRVGVQGQKAEEFMKNIDVGIKEYNKKLNEKTKRNYQVVQMNYEENATEEKNQNEKKTEQEGPKSTLEPSVQDLIRLMFDMKMMNNQMKEIGYDAKKMPLGKLAKSSIKKGYEALQKLMEEIKGKKRDEIINELSGDFYTAIPHDFGFKPMSNFVLKKQTDVKAKLQMLQSLQQIQVFTKLVEQSTISSDVNELDANYLKLNMKIKPLDKKSDLYNLLLKYVQNTHASTHTAYKLTVMDIFELQKDIQLDRYKKDLNNKQLLWHGSRLTNFVGILSQGLRIAPPEAPVTGYMFGKGVYFADMVTKSANYCFASRGNDVGLMLLCEVALGEMNQKYYADYYANLLPQGKHSTKGVGRTAPKEGQMLDDVLVPCGQSTSTGSVNTSLLYNEYIVYDVAQIKCRYLFKMKFNYK